MLNELRKVPAYSMPQQLQGVPSSPMYTGMLLDSNAIEFGSSQIGTARNGMGM